MHILPKEFPQLTSRLPKIWVDSYYEEKVEDVYDENCMGHFIFATYTSVANMLSKYGAAELLKKFPTYQWGAKVETINTSVLQDLPFSIITTNYHDNLFFLKKEERLGFLRYYDNMLKSGNELELPTKDTIAKYMTSIIVTDKSISEAQKSLCLKFNEMFTVPEKLGLYRTYDYDQIIEKDGLGSSEFIKFEIRLKTDILVLKAIRKLDIALESGELSKLLSRMGISLDSDSLKLPFIDTWTF